MDKGKTLLQGHSVGCGPSAAFSEEHEEAIIDLEGEEDCAREMLRKVERQFIAYFIDKIGPSRKTEAVRESVFSTLTEILDSKYGESAF